jgi:hypothetical protein
VEKQEMQRFTTVGCFLHVFTQLFKHVAQASANIGVIIHYQHSLFRLTRREYDSSQCPAPSL